jgi:glyoxylase-like metal-dependent hydrolase (beta-lactamase superfamily II)
MARAGLPAYVEALGGGVYAIDTAFHRDHFDAAYLVVEAGRAAFIDTGTNHAVRRLLNTLAALGLALEAVDFVIPTHVHLDHAGGVGALMRELPKAQLVVHPRGAPHLIDPTRLYQGALAVYGAAEMERSYGELLPVDATRVQASEEWQTVELAGRPLLIAHTPGHARHHHCIWDEKTQGWFTGDTFGLSYREFDSAQGPWIVPTSTPVQFEPEALRDSISRLLELEPECMYLTHFGRVRPVPRLGAMLFELLDAMVALGLRLKDAPGRHEALKAGLGAIYLASLRQHGCELPEARISELLAMDLELNAQGMACWLDRVGATP